MNKNLAIVFLLLIVAVFLSSVVYFGFFGEIFNAKKESSIPAPKINIIALIPTMALEGYKKQSGPMVPAGELDESRSCLTGLTSQDDESYCAAGQKNGGWNKGAGVAEIYFEIPAEIASNKIVKTNVNLNLICSSGIGLYSLTEFGEWARFGGTNGYLSCSYGAGERKSLSLPVSVYEGKTGVRIIQEEATSYAFVDKAALEVSYEEISNDEQK